MNNPLCLHDVLFLKNTVNLWYIPKLKKTFYSGELVLTTYIHVDTFSCIKKKYISTFVHICVN